MNNDFQITFANYHDQWLPIKHQSDEKMSGLGVVVKFWEQQ